MAISEFAKKYHERMFPEYESDFLRTDPEFIERFDNFAFDEVINQNGVQLDDKTRFLVILATLLGCQGVDEFEKMLPAALSFSVTPVEIKETVYQATAYLGIGRVFPFLKATNKVFEAQGISLPLEGQATTSTENRRGAGTQTQVDIFGEGMRDFWKSGAMTLWEMRGNANCYFALKDSQENIYMVHFDDLQARQMVYGQVSITDFTELQTFKEWLEEQ